MIGISTAISIKRSRFSKKNHDLIIAEVPGYRELLNETLYQRLEHYAKLFLSRIRDTPQKRYEDLVKEHPQLIQRIPQHYIMMKGFIDKVIFPGVAYDYDRSGRFPRMIKRWGRLQGITLITTMNSASLVYRLIFGNAIKKALFAGTFWKMGYRHRKWINFGMVKFVSQEKRQRWLAQLTRRFSDLRAA